MPDWDEDSEVLKENLIRARLQARDQAFERVPPSVDLARLWHTTTMEGLDVPGDQYVARFRGEEGLKGCEVTIGAHRGVSSSQVKGHLSKLEKALQNTVPALDHIIPKGDAPGNSDQINAVIELSAWVHAEWVRIHPFANGNGRTARIWVGFIVMRYGVRPFLNLRPRPGGNYGTACSKAMEGDWEPTAQLFRRMYLDSFR